MIVKKHIISLMVMSGVDTACIPLHLDLDPFGFMFIVIYLNLDSFFVIFILLSYSDLSSFGMTPASVHRTFLQ